MRWLVGAGEWFGNKGVWNSFWGEPGGLGGRVSSFADGSKALAQLSALGNLPWSPMGARYQQAGLGLAHQQGLQALRHMESPLVYGTSRNPGTAPACTSL